jgi:predicted nucleic acid-binding Zn ribbon protein
MLPIQQFSARVLTEIVRRQPPSPARTTFAWQMAVGAALARVTKVSMDDAGVLTVTAADDRWRAEIDRARDVALRRLQTILGDEIKSVRIARIG